MTEPTITLITPCHNDGWALPGLWQSLSRQTATSFAWCIVDDSSDDDSLAVAQSIASSDPRVVVTQHNRAPGRRIEEKARAINRVLTTSAGTLAPVVGILDSDVSLPPSYLKSAEEAFMVDPQLGVWGGRYLETGHGTLSPGGWHVPGPAQMWRREALVAIGGYEPLRWGGDDVVSVSMAVMRGWKAKRNDTLTYTHRRRQGTGGNRSTLQGSITLGRQDWDLGVPWWFEAFKLARWAGRRPRLMGAAARLYGYTRGALAGEVSVSSEYIAFCRRNQRQRLPRWVR